MNETTTIMISLASAILFAYIGYVVGTLRAFYEAKQKAYVELLPPIIKMAYNREANTADEVEYCKACIKLWLFGSKKVTLKMEEALKTIHQNNGDTTRALQETIVEMRKDIFKYHFCEKLKPEDVNHFYTRIKESMEKKKKLN